jgi:hypothetical protein
VADLMDGVAGTAAAADGPVPARRRRREGGGGVSLVIGERGEQVRQRLVDGVLHNPALKLGHARRLDAAKTTRRPYRCSHLRQVPTTMVRTIFDQPDAVDVAAPVRSGRHRAGNQTPQGRRTSGRGARTCSRSPRSARVVAADLVHQPKKNGSTEKSAAAPPASSGSSSAATP